MKQPKYSCKVNFRIEHFFANIFFLLLRTFFIIIFNNSISKPIEEKENARYVTPF